MFSSMSHRIAQLEAQLRNEYASVTTTFFIASDFGGLYVVSGRLRLRDANNDSHYVAVADGNVTHICSAVAACNVAGLDIEHICLMQKACTGHLHVRFA